MARQLDISKGIDPVTMSFDQCALAWLCRADGKSYRFDARTMPFTMKDYCADKALVLKHGR